MIKWGQISELKKIPRVSKIPELKINPQRIPCWISEPYKCAERIVLYLQVYLARICRRHPGALQRIFRLCWIPKKSLFKSSQTKRKYLPNFQKFQTHKNPSITHLTWNSEYTAPPSSPSLGCPPRKFQQTQQLLQCNCKDVCSWVFPQITNLFLALLSIGLPWIATIPFR